MHFHFETFIKRLIRHFYRLDRISIIWYIAVFIGFFILIWIFNFTIWNHSYYKAIANKQQRLEVKNPVSRGTISSSEQSLHGVAAISTNLGTLAIDPTQSGSTEKLLDFLSDAVVMEFCAHTTHTECMHNISAYIREDMTNEENITKKILKDKITTYIQTRMNAPIESVLLSENISEQMIETINSWNEDALFFVANNLYVNPTKVVSIDALADKIAKILDTNPKNITPKLVIRKKEYLEIIRKMNINTDDFVKKFLEKNREFVRGKISEEASKLLTTEERNQAKKDIIKQYAIYPFINIQNNLVRFYPERNTLGQITGFVDSEGVGRYGIEGYFENILQGENPKQIITKDIKGRAIRDYTSSGVLNSKNGTDITLTIDRNIQKELSRQLKQAVHNFRANRGSIIVMEPKTGAITAMVNYPDFDPNNFTEVYEMERVLYETYPNPAFDLFGFPLYVIDTSNGTGSTNTITTNIDGKHLKLREATDFEISNAAIEKFKFKNGFGVGNYKNDVISALYEPGSVFKALTVAIGIDTGEIRPTDTYYDKNYVELDLGGGVKRRINNLAKSNCGGRHTYANALNWSCNVGMIDIVQKVGRPLFEEYLHKFGLGMKSNITIDGEVYGEIADRNKWSRMQFFTMSFGQGINITMLQMAVIYSVIANGGVYMQPYIVESQTDANGKKIDTVPTPIQRVLKEETSKTVTKMLVDGAEHGFAAKGGVPGYAVAGKTGTSQIPYRGTYENIYFRQDIGHTTTSYGGFAPAYNPKFVMIVRIERPRTSVYAEQTSAAVFAEAAKYLLKYYNIPQQ